MKKKKVWRYNWSHTVKWRTFIHCHVCRVNSNLDSSFKETKWTLWNLFIKHILWRCLGPFRKRNNAELWEQTRVEICTVKRSKHRNGRCQVLTRPCRNVSMWHLDTLLFCMLNILNGNKSQLYLHMNTNSMCLKSSFGRHLLMWSMKKNKTGGGGTAYLENYWNILNGILPFDFQGQSWKNTLPTQTWSVTVATKEQMEMSLGGRSLQL